LIFAKKISYSLHKKLKIAVNTRFLIKGKLEGLGWYTHEIMQRMVLAHPEVEFHFLFDRAYAKEFIYGPNVFAHVLRPPARHPILWYLWFEFAVTRTLKRIKPDVFFSPDTFLSLRSKIPTVLTVHDLIPWLSPDGIPALGLKYYKHFWPKYMSKAAHLIAISDYTKQKIIDLFQVDQQQITCIYNGYRKGFSLQKIDSLTDHQIKTNAPQITKDEKGTVGRLRQIPAGHTNQISRALPPNLATKVHSPYFLATGSIHPRKNTARLIQAFEEYKNRYKSAHQLILAGKVMHKSTEIATLVEKSAFRHEIILTGYISDQDLQALTQGADASVYISLEEGFGLPILEAMAAAVPLITSNTSSMPEVAGRAAILVNPNDTQAIVWAMHHITTNQNTRKQLIANGLERMKLFEWDDAAKATYHVLMRVAETTKR
jgi:glycosyltransferase involved in cell wall biosynthesis